MPDSLVTLCQTVWKVKMEHAGVSLNSTGGARYAISAHDGARGCFRSDRGCVVRKP
jgi:hypothetical protein